jgi:hypothetical protein
MAPSSVSVRLSGHAIDGSSILSPCPEICAYQSKTSGFAAAVSPAL